MVPAKEIVGNESTIITTVSGEFGHVPNAVVQTKVLTPFVKPVTSELLMVLVITEPPPLTTVQIPNPIVGVFPLNIAVEVQIVWSMPA